MLKYGDSAEVAGVSCTITPSGDDRTAVILQNDGGDALVTVNPWSWNFKKIRGEFLYYRVVTVENDEGGEEEIRIPVYDEDIPAVWKEWSPDKTELNLTGGETATLQFAYPVYDRYEEEEEEYEGAVFFEITVDRGSESTETVVYRIYSF